MSPYSNRINALTKATALLGFLEAARYLRAASEMSHPDNVKFYLDGARRLLDGEIFATHALAEINDIMREASFDANRYWLLAGREMVGV